MNYYQKILIMFLILYLIFLVYKLDYKNFMWDETYVAAPVIFWLDFIKYFLNNPTLNINKIISYGLNYQSHYIFFSQMLWHPPLYKILVFFSLILFGINEFAARLPSVFFSIMGLFFTYLIGKEISSKKFIGLISAIFLGLSPLYYQFSRVCTPDIPVVVMITISMFFLLRYLKHKKRKDSILFGLFFGLSLLTKEFAISIILSSFLFILLTKKYKLLKDKNIYFSYFLAGVIFIPWLLFVNFIPSFLDIPYVFIEKYGSHMGFNVSLHNLPIFYLKQFSYVIGFLSILGLIYLIKRREDSDFFLISWIVVFYLFPLLFIGPSSSNLHRFTMPIMPALAISGSIFMNKVVNFNKIKNYGSVIFILTLILSLLVSIDYNLRVNIRYPVENATIWTLQNTEKNGGILYDDKGIQFYFMKHDRNLSVRTAECTSKECIFQFLYQEYSKFEYEKLGIKNPKFYYLIVKEPLMQSNNFFKKIDDKDIYTTEQSFFEELFEYINQNKNLFKLKRIFYGNRPDANVFLYEIIEID